MLGSYSTLKAFEAPIREFENSLGLLRGNIGSRKSAAIVGLYYPNPNVSRVNGLKASCFSCATGAAVLEALGTGILAFVVFSLGHPRNKTLGKEKALMVSTININNNSVLFE
jgi:hypothetical protein